jgi:hypothetical protein
MIAPAEVILTGPMTHVVGGRGGFNWAWAFNCHHDGYPGCGVQGVGSVQHSGSLVEGGFADVSEPCLGAWQEVPFCGPTVALEVPVGPSLEVTGTIQPGATVTVRVYGEHGGNVALHLGRGLILAPTPGVLVESLVPANRVILMGPIWPAGFVSRTLVLPSTLAPGTIFGAQAEVTTASGIQRTNSVPIVLR